MKLTKPQQVSLLRVWKRDRQGMTYLQFRRTVQAGWDCVMVRWAGMYVGIEACGYAHS
jgi:transposase